MFEEGYAPFPSLAIAEARIKEAEEMYAATMKALFPVGRIVTVNHYHGSYRAEIVGIEAWRRGIRVRNLATGKITRPFPGMRVGIGKTDRPCVVLED